MLATIKNKIFPHNPVRGLLSTQALLALKKMERRKPGSIQLFGSEISFSDNLGFLHSLEEIFKEEVYKFKTDATQPYIIDAGANIGLSLIYFKRLYPAAKLVAFEPDPDIYQLLVKNAAALELTDVDLRNAAVWTDDTNLTFYAEGSLAGSTEVSATSNGRAYSVKAERLKNWLTAAPVDFLKIDIEGGENVLFFDIGKELRNVRNLFLEYHSIAGQEQLLGQMLQLIQDAGFRYNIKTAFGLLDHPFVDRIHNGFDLQLNIFCYRP